MIDFDKSKRFRRLIIFWAMALVTGLLIWTWISPPVINAGTASVLGVVVGLIATAFGFYQREDFVEAGAGY